MLFNLVKPHKDSNKKILFILFDNDKNYLITLNILKKLDDSSFAYCITRNIKQNLGKK